MFERKRNYSRNRFENTRLDLAGITCVYQQGVVRPI
jgi:hypothetical protein